MDPSRIQPLTIRLKAKIGTVLSHCHAAATLPLEETVRDLCAWAESTLFDLGSGASELSGRSAVSEVELGISKGSTNCSCVSFGFEDLTREMAKNAELSRKVHEFSLKTAEREVAEAFGGVRKVLERKVASMLGSVEELERIQIFRERLTRDEIFAGSLQSSF